MNDNYSELNIDSERYTYCSCCNGDIKTQADIAIETSLRSLCVNCKDVSIAHMPGDDKDVWERLESFNPEGSIEDVMERLSDYKKDYLESGEYKDLKIEVYKEWHDDTGISSLWGLRK